jgi:hypothetical protein
MDDLGSKRGSNSKFAVTDRANAFVKSGQSTFGGPGTMRLKSEILGGTRYSKMNITNSKSTLHEGSVAFNFGQGAAIPDASIHRSGEMRAERMGSLTRVPAHKPNLMKFSGDPAHRTIAPLTYEDLGQFGNISLISTLRVDVSPNRKVDSMGVPPSFFDDDMNKWEKKFSAAVADRANIKKHMMKTLDLNARNVVNGNVHADSEFFDVEKRLADHASFPGG